MGTVTVFLCAAIVIVACVQTSQATGCPPPEKIYDYTKKESCRSNGDCKNGKICCLNPARVKSCTYPDPHGGSRGGPSSTVMCEGVKCQPFEVCKTDPNNNRRKKCQRA